MPESRLVTATHWGIVHPVLDKGRLIGLEPFAADPAPSPVLHQLARLPYCGARILRPAVREGYLSGKTDGSQRGKERFIEVDWDTALDLAAGSLDRVYRTKGPSAVFGRSYGWKSTGSVNASINLLQRLLNLSGGFVRAVNSYSTAAIAAILPYVVGESDPRSESWESLLEHSERIVFWGCNPLRTNNIDWTTTLHNSYPYFTALAKSSIVTYSINPVRTETADALGSRQISPVPGTDCALMLGIMHELVHLGVDERLLLQMTDGWPVLKNYLRGSEDGVEKTPRWASGVTGISESVIRELARDWSTHRTKIVMGWGMQRRPYGEQFPWMGYALAAVLGQIGLPGGGISTNMHYCSGGSPRAVGPAVRGISERVGPVRDFRDTGPLPVIPVARFVDCFLNPGKTIEHNGRKVTYPDVDLVFWAGGNPFAQQPQTLRLAKAWQKPSTTIVADTVWTPTARMADIVLPAQTVFEHNDITGIGSYTNDGIVAMQRCIEPVGQARSDYAIMTGLAARLGVADAFTEGKTEDGWIRTIYENTRKAGNDMGVPLPEFESFWRQGVHLYETDEASRHFVPFARFRANPATHPLKTESGRITLFSPKIATYGYADCPGHPSYLTEGMPEDEALHYLCPKSRWRLHSQLDAVNEHKGRDGREPCLINPADARRRNVAEGDTVILENRFGRSLACAHLTEKISAGSILLAHGGWFEAFEGNGADDNHGAANVLTEDKPTSPLSCGNTASGGWVRVRRFSPEPAAS